MQHFFRTHPHFQLRDGVHLEGPSKTRQQTLTPFAYYSAKYHLPDIEKPIVAHLGSSGIVYPMFQQLVLLCSYEKYTNVTKLIHVKDSLLGAFTNNKEYKCDTNLKQMDKALQESGK